MKEEDKNPKNDIANQYDSYYENTNGEGSIYDQQYHDKVLPRDRWVIKDAALKLINKKFPKGSIIVQPPINPGIRKKVRMVDFGCGDGRYFSVIEEIANSLQTQDIEVELVAYDPSAMGLKVYQEKLYKKGFKTENIIGERKEPERTPGKLGYVNNVLKKDNITINFIHSNVEDTIEHTKTLIGEVDITLCMFGVLSHIPGRENRQKILKMFNDITNPDGYVILTVPGPWRFTEEQNHYSFLREKQKSPHLLATEPGDIYYAKFKGPERKALNFYHIYTSRELLEDLNQANLIAEKGIEGNYILDIHTLTGGGAFSGVLAKLDEWLSWLTPESFVDSTNSYMLATTTPSRNR